MNVARQTGVAFLGRGVIRLSQFVAFVVLARMLTPTDFGWFGILTTAIGLAATLGSLGLRQSLAYEIGQGRMSAGVATGTAVAIWPVLVLVSGGVLVLLYRDGLPMLGAIELDVIIFAGVAGAILLTMLQGVFLGDGRIGSFSSTDAAPRLILMAGTVALLLLGIGSLSTAMWVFAASYVVSLPWVVHLASKGAGRWRVAPRRFAPILAYGLTFAFNLFLTTLSYRIAMFAAEVHLGAGAAAQFFAASRINEMLLELATATGMVLFSRATRNSSASTAVHQSVRLAAVMFWFFALIAAVVVVFASVILRIVVGNGYVAAVPVLQIVAISLPASAATKVIYPSIAGAGRPHFGTPVIAIGLALTGILAFTLTPTAGVIGGALALLAGQSALLLGYAITCRREFGMSLFAPVVPEASDLARFRRMISGVWRRGLKSDG